MDSRYTREGSGVAAPGAKTFFMVLLGMEGENVEVEGLLLVMADARKMFLAVPIELGLRLLGGSPSRVVNSFRLDEA